MKNFEGKLAVITGGGTGMGRELARQLVTAGCQVAMCDLSLETMAETRELCEQDAPQGVVSTFQADVADEQQVLAFRDAVQHVHDTDHIHLLFNNAGIGGGGSFINDSRQEWDRTFGVCWSGVYFCTAPSCPCCWPVMRGISSTRAASMDFGLLWGQRAPIPLTPPPSSR